MTRFWIQVSLGTALEWGNCQLSWREASLSMLAVSRNSRQPVTCSSSTTNPQAQHHILHDIHHCFISQLLLGIWWHYLYNLPTCCHRWIVRAFFNGFPRPACLVGRHLQSTLQNKLAWFHAYCQAFFFFICWPTIIKSSQINRYAPQFLSSSNPPCPPPAKIPLGFSQLSKSMTTSHPFAMCAWRSLTPDIIMKAKAQKHS